MKISSAINKIGFCFHLQLIPLYACVFLGSIGAVGYLLRLATRNPDVSWNRKGNPNPNEEYRTKQYKVSHLLSFISNSLFSNSIPFALITVLLSNPWLQ